MKLHLPVRLFRTLIIALGALSTVYANDITSSNADASFSLITDTSLSNPSLEYKGNTTFIGNGANSLSFTSEVVQTSIRTGVIHSGVWDVDGSYVGKRGHVITFTNFDTLSLHGFNYKSSALAYSEEFDGVLYQGAEEIGGSAFYVLYNSADVKWIDNKNINISNNTSFSDFSSNTNVVDARCTGGAISCADTDIQMSGAQNINISGNKAITHAASGNATAEGGALYDFSATVSFEGNNDGRIMFTDNSSEVSNSAEEKGISAAAGGAIYFTSCVKFSMSNNIGSEVAFTRNSALASAEKGTAAASGGAIHALGNSGYDLEGYVNIDNNKSVDFQGNSAVATGYTAQAGGGAIYTNLAAISISGNKKVQFTGNYAETSTHAERTSDCSGGAIYTNSHEVSICNNGDVLFKGNYTRNGDFIQLNSIYAGGDKSVVHLSSAENGKITMHDAITMVNRRDRRIGELSLNANYEGTAQNGTIVFTGVETEALLKDIKGSEATPEEIKASRTYVSKATTLYNGTLSLEGGVILQSDTITVKGGALVIETGDSVEAGVLEVSGAEIRLRNADQQETATISVTQSITLNSDSVFKISLADGYTSESLRVAIVGLASDGTENNNDWMNIDKSSLKLNSALWEASEFSIEIEDNVAYAVTTLASTKNDDNVVVVKNKDVILSSENALGEDSIETSGNTSLSTEAGVTVNLPDIIQNKGELTISGSFDASKIDAPGSSEADTRVCVDGKEGLNGFFRDGDTVITVVENGVGATLTVSGNTVITKDGVELHLADSGKAGKLDYSNYHIEEDDHSAAMSEILGMRPDADEDLAITMNDGKLIVDEDAKNIRATGSEIIVDTTAAEAVTVGGSLSGDVALQVVNGTAEIEGDHSYSGSTTISGENSQLIVTSDKALGQSEVLLKDGATLNLGSNRVSNSIEVEGCTITGAENYAGNLTAVKDCNLKVIGNATANKITLKDNGSITGENLLATTYEMSSKASGRIAANVATRHGGTIILNDGSVLTVDGSLTLGSGTTFELNGDGYQSGSILATATEGVTETQGRVIYAYGYGTYTAADGAVTLTGLFNQNDANAFTMANWGIATASRAFVNTVRGQRNNTGCIANGKGTAWFSLLGASNNLKGGDVSVEGAAVGADMKVGKCSVMGVAFGYTDGKVSPTGLRKVEQDGYYAAVYGEHGLRKLSADSCLSLDWVAAYGTTESHRGELNWEQDSLQLNARVNWNKQLSNRLGVTAFAGVEYFANESDTAEGAKSGSIQNLRGELGVGVSYVVWGAPDTEPVTDEKGGLVSAGTAGCRKLVLHGELRYFNDLVRSNPVVEMAGIRGMGTNPGRQGFGVEAGATYRINDRWTTSANYGFNAMEDSQEHRVNVGASYTF